MADKLVKLMDETGYRQLINMLISIKSSQQENVEKCISVWQPRTRYEKDKVVLVINDTTYSEYVCKATHESGETFNETYWTLVSCVDFEGYTEEELLAMLNLSQEELDNLQNILNDDEIQTDHAWSSSKVYTEIINCLIESKKFTIAEVAKIVSFSYKVVTSEDEVVDDKAIYLIENSSGTHDMYLLVDGSPSKVGNTNIDLSDYLKKENIVNTFDETTTYTDSDKVFSTQAVKSAYDDLNDKKISKSNIVTTLDDTVTNEQVVGAKAMYDELTTAIGEKANTIDLTTHTSNTDIHITSAERTKWNKVTDKVDKTNITTTIDSSSTDSQVPSAKAVYDKYSLHDLSEASTNVLNNALMVDTRNQYSVLNKDCLVTSSSIQVPSNLLWGIRQVFWHTDSDLVLKITGKDTNNKSCIWINSLMRKDGKHHWQGWQRVCTTSVPDIPLTQITFIHSDFTGIIATYYIDKGTCYVDFKGGAPVNVSANIQGVTIAKLPRPKNEKIHRFTTWSSPHEALFILYTNGNLNAYVMASNSNALIYTGFSYPVAEDWRP